MPHQLKIALRAVAGVLALSLGAASTSLAAQVRPARADTGLTAARDSAAAPVIRGEDIPVKADETSAHLHDIEGLLARDPAITKVTAEAKTMAASIPGLLNVQEGVTSRSMTRRALLDYILEWDRRAEQVGAWRQTLRARIDDLQKGRTELGQWAGWWRTAVEQLRADATAVEVLTLARSSLRDVQDLDRKLKSRLNELLATEVQLSDLQLTIQRQREAFNQLAAEQRRDLFRIDSPPLWKAGGELSPRSLATSVGKLWLDNTRALADFIQLYGVRLLLHLILTLFLVRFFRRGRDRLLADPNDPLHTEPASVVLQRPEAAAILPAILAVVWFYPRAPVIVYDIALLATVAPMMQLRTVLVPAPLQRPGLMVGWFVVVHRLISIFGSGTGLERIGALAISVAGAALLWRGLQVGGPLRAQGGDRWLAMVELVAKVVLAGTGLSLLANLVGNVSLATVTVNTLLILTYIAMVLVAASRILTIAMSEAVRVGSGHSVFIQTYEEEIRRRSHRLIDTAAVLIWVWLALFSYYLTDDLVATFGNWLGTSWSLGEVNLSMGAILLFIAVIWIGAMIARFVSLVLELDVLGRLSLPRGVPVTVASLVKYALVAIAFLTALAATGFELSQLAIIGGALGVGIGFGLQNIVGNFIAGLILAFERPISIGDIVQLADMIGEVRQIGIRASILRTFDGAEVIVPNSEFISREVINWTRSDRYRRIEVKVGVAYGSDPGKVLELLLTVARTHPEVSATPEPDARFIGFGDSSLDFSLRFWVEFIRWTQIQSAVAVAVHDALAAAGITIPFPQRDLHFKTADPALLDRIGPRPGGRPAGG
jgi:small-conductance mechanosensitive channel